MTLSLKSAKGFAQIPLLIGLLIMAIAVPVATNLVQQNQNTQNRAWDPGDGDCSQTGCNSGYYCDTDGTCKLSNACTPNWVNTTDCSSSGTLTQGDGCGNYRTVVCTPATGCTPSNETCDACTGSTQVCTNGCNTYNKVCNAPTVAVQSKECKYNVCTGITCSPLTLNVGANEVCPDKNECDINNPYSCGAPTLVPTAVPTTAQTPNSTCNPSVDTSAFCQNNNLYVCDNAGGTLGNRWILKTACAYSADCNASTKSCVAGGCNWYNNHINNGESKCFDDQVYNHSDLVTCKDGVTSYVGYSGKGCPTGVKEGATCDPNVDTGFFCKDNSVYSCQVGYGTLPDSWTVKMNCSGYAVCNAASGTCEQKTDEKCCCFRPLVGSVMCTYTTGDCPSLYTFEGYKPNNSCETLPLVTPTAGSSTGKCNTVGDYCCSDWSDLDNSTWYYCSGTGIYCGGQSSSSKCTGTAPTIPVPTMSSGASCYSEGADCSSTSWDSLNCCSGLTCAVPYYGATTKNCLNLNVKPSVGACLNEPGDCTNNANICCSGLTCTAPYYGAATKNCLNLSVVPSAAATLCSGLYQRATQEKPCCIGYSQNANGDCVVDVVPTGTTGNPGTSGTCAANTQVNSFGCNGSISASTWANYACKGTPDGKVCGGSTPWIWLSRDSSCNCSTNCMATASGQCINQPGTTPGVVIPNPTTGPAATSVPANTSTPAKCTRNSSATSTDFSVWKSELIAGGFGKVSKTTWSTDYNCDGYINLVDFSVWREAYIKSLNGSN